MVCGAPGSGWLNFGGQLFEVFLYSSPMGCVWECLGVEPSKKNMTLFFGAPVAWARFNAVGCWGGCFWVKRKYTRLSVGALSC